MDANQKWEGIHVDQGAFSEKPESESGQVCREHP